MYHLHLHFQFAKKSLAIKETLTMWSKHLSWCFVQQRDIVCQLADNDEFNWALNFFKMKCKGFDIWFKCDKTLIEFFLFCFYHFFAYDSLSIQFSQLNFNDLLLLYSKFNANSWVCGKCTQSKFSLQLYICLVKVYQYFFN